MLKSLPLIANSS